VSQVFEARLPLAWDAMLALGCCAVVAPHASARPLGEIFTLTDLSVRRRPRAHPSNP